MLPSFNAQIIAIYSDYFEEKEILEDALEGMDRQTLLKVATYFLNYNSYDQTDSFRSFDFVSNFFSQENEPFAARILRRTREIEKEAYQNGLEPKRIHFLTNYSCLVLFETIYSTDSKPREMSMAQIEQGLFKAILLINEQNEKGINLPVNGLNTESDFRHFFFSMAFWQWDITNYSPKMLLVSEAIKSSLLFEFLDQNQQTRLLLKEFEGYFGVESWQEFFCQILGWILHSFNVNKTNSLIITLKGSDQKMAELIDRICLSPTADANRDFIHLRAKPIYKLDTWNYRIIYNQFFFELLHQGMYFHLLRLNADSNPPRIKNFRSFYCHEFSEKYLLYSILETIYSNKYKKFSGQQISDLGIDGEPDYYIRNGSKIFLFESKDVLINAEIKTSKSPERIVEALKQKFFKTDKKPKAIIQLVNCIQSIFSESYNFDSFNGSRSTIYPIIIVYNRIFTAPGVNNLLSEWFEAELDRRNFNSHFRQRVHPITLVLIDDLIYYQDLLKNRTWKLETLLSNYHKYIKPQPLKENEEFSDYVSRQNRRYVSFSDYLEYFSRKQNEKATPKAFVQRCNAIIDSLKKDEGSE